MTWVVGTPTMFGYGFGISDIRVTLVDGSEVDCLQKIYPVGRYIAAGFAGSVRIGFAMIDELRKRANLADEKLSCDPNLVAREWPEYARTVFDSSSPQEQASQCHLMLISAHPNEHNGNPNWPRCYVHIFRSPTFEAEAVPVHTLGSIGCGNRYEPCKEMIEKFNSDNDRRMFYAQGGGTLGGMGTMIGIDLTNLLMRVQPGGISEHLHYCWVYRGKITISTNDHTQKGRWSIIPLGSENAPTSPSQSGTLDDGSVVFAMSTIATTWEEFHQLLASRGSSAKGCVA
jgi:hypothetical protein